jgi:hypothetical protein
VAKLDCRLLEVYDSFYLGERYAGSERITVYLQDKRDGNLFADFEVRGEKLTACIAAALHAF